MSQCLNKKMGKNEIQTTTSTEIEDFVEKFEKDFLWSLVFQAMVVQGLRTLEHGLWEVVHLGI